MTPRFQQTLTTVPQTFQFPKLFKRLAPVNRKGNYASSHLQQLGLGHSDRVTFDALPALLVMGDE
jgi:hypothetical protein